MQSSLCCGLPDLCPIAREQVHLGMHQAINAPSQPDGANRFLGRTPSRSSNAGDGNADMSFGSVASTQSHGTCHGLTDSTVLHNQCCRHAQQFCFGFVGISHNAAFKPSAGTCQIGALGRNHAACAAFGGGHRPFQIEQLLGQALDSRVHHTHLHKAITSRVQAAATRSSKRMPQPPRQPKPLNS